MNLISIGNMKTMKSVKQGYLTGILHLRPNYTICPNASKGCMAACLNTAGRGSMNTVQQARQRRTDLWTTDIKTFRALLEIDIEKLRKRAHKKGLKLAIRLNGTSDIPWWLDMPTLFKQFPDVMFYDYTPNYERMCCYLNGHDEWPSNYQLCYSLKEDNWRDSISILEEHGGNVAVVFRDELPKTWRGKQVVDGDEHDLRFLDPANVVVGLRAKGKAKKDTSGFVQEAI